MSGSVVERLRALTQFSPGPLPMPYALELRQDEATVLLALVEAVREADDYYKLIELPPAGTPWTPVRLALAALYADDLSATSGTAS